MVNEPARKKMQFSAWNILKRLLISFLLISSIGIYIAFRGLDWSLSPFDKNPYVCWSTLNADPSTMVEIRWETSILTNSDLWYGLNPTSLLYLPNATQSKMHVVNLTGLIPGQRYYYKISENSDELRTFRTAPTTITPFNFTLVSDTQALLGIGHMGRVFQAIARLQDTSFVVDIGDVVQDGSNQRDWNFFFRTGDQWLKKFAIVPITGNHDGDYKDNYSSSLYPHYFGYADPVHQRLYYSFNWSNVQIVMMQMGHGGESNLQWDGGLQLTWLNQTLANGQDKAFRIVMFHRNVFSSEMGQMAENTIRDLVPILDYYNVSLVLHGHHHVYQRFLHQGRYGEVTYVCLGCGGGLQDVTHTTGGWDFVELQAINNGPAYSMIFVNGNDLYFKHFAPSGELIDSFHLQNQNNRAIQVAGGMI